MGNWKQPYVRALWAGFATSAAAFALCGWAQAGVIFFAGKLEEGTFVPDRKAKGPCFSVRYSTTTIEIDGENARTRIEETVVGHAEGVSNLVCIIPLPEGADVLHRVQFEPRLSWTGPERLSPDEARKVYEVLARAMDSVQVLSLAGSPALLVRQLPASVLEDKAKVVIEYSQRVKVTNGLHSFESPMPAAAFAKEPVSRTALTARVRNRLPLRAVFCPTHETIIERNGLHEAAVRVSGDDWTEGGSFRLHYVADTDPVGLRVITHRGAEDEDGYFMVIGNPTGSPEGQKPLEKDVVFVLDTSGSMRGEKIEQARAAVEYCLEELNPGDRFNIITFGTEVHGFRDGPVEGTKQNLDAAFEFIDEVVAAGRTNVGEALTRGLAGKPLPGRLRIMIFLTDGTPTAGELVPERIVKKVQEANTSRTHVFVMGLGHDVNAHLLDRLAEETDGSSEYVDIDEEIDVKMAALYDRLSNPVLADAEIDFGELATHSVYPKRMGALFRGTEVSVTGRYRGGDAHTVTISGELAGRPVRYSCKAAFPEGMAPQNDYAATLWAARKIGFLLQEIRLHGENKELVEEVVRLSRRFGIVTEYTAFIAAAGEDMSDEKAAEEAIRRMSTANAQKSGMWAFNQARNDRQLQQRAVAARSANSYVDRRGKVRRVDTVRQVGRRVFYLRDGRWVDAENAGDRKAREVKLFSDEYFELLRNNEEFARAQAVGQEISINVGEERIVVKK